MPRYRFRLQRVLETKEREEERCKLELAIAERRLGREERRLEEHFVEWERSRQEVLRPAARVLDLAREAGWRSYFEYLAREIRRQREAVKHCARNVTAARTELLEASKEKKALERLKEKGRLAFLREMDRREQKELDEIGRDLYLRNRKRPAART